MTDTQHADQESHGGLGKYLAVFVLLCLLTSASFFTYSSYWPFKDTPDVGRTFMMAVSCTKAMLVICFFMHMLWEANWKYVVTIPAGILSVFLILILVPDIGWRMNTGFASYSEERLSHITLPQAEHAENTVPAASSPAEPHAVQSEHAQSKHAQSEHAQSEHKTSAAQAPQTEQSP